MYLLYVDESGDPGLINSPTRFFILSGIAVHDSNWRVFNESLRLISRTLKGHYGLPARYEIHAGPFMNKPQLNIPKYKRLSMLQRFIDDLAIINYISITNVVVDKQGKPPHYNVFENAWKALFQRFENTLLHGNFPGGFRDNNGLIFTDATSGKKLATLTRKMTAYNPIPNLGGGGYRQIPTLRIIEDPQSRDSAESLCIQACDVVAYFLYQKFAQNSYFRRKSATNYFDKLLPVLNTSASRTSALGIVLL